MAGRNKHTKLSCAFRFLARPGLRATPSFHRPLWMRRARTPTEASQETLRRSQERPGCPLGDHPGPPGPKRLHWRPQEGPGRPQEAPGRPQDAPGGPQETQRGPQETPKRSQRNPMRPPSGPKRSPRGSQEVPKSPQEPPRDPQEAPKRPPRAPEIVSNA